MKGKKAPSNCYTALMKRINKCPSPAQPGFNRKMIENSCPVIFQKPLIQVQANALAVQQLMYVVQSCSVKIMSSLYPTL